MKAINIKLATFSFAALLLASCSDSNTESTSPVSPAMNPKLLGIEATSNTDAQTLAARVINYKTPTTRASRASYSDVFGGFNSMPAQPTPTGNEVTGDITSTEQSGNYIVSSDKSINLGNVNNTNIYVKAGTLTLGNVYQLGDNVNIWVLPGATLKAHGGYGIFNSQKITIYNYGTFTLDGDQAMIAANTTIYNNGDFDLSDKQVGVQGKLYVGGDLKIKSWNNYYGDASAYTYIGGELKLTEKNELGLNGNFYFGGLLEANTIKVYASAKVFSGCGIIAKDLFEINSNNCEAHIAYLKAGKVEQSATSFIYLKNNSFIETPNYVNHNAGVGAVTVEGDNAVAYIISDKLHYNHSDGNKNGLNMFRVTGNQSKLYFKGVFCEEWTDNPVETTLNNNADVIAVTADNINDFTIKKDGCNPGHNDNSDPTNPDPTPTPPSKKPDIELISTIEYGNHTHNISATCIKEYNNKMYMSYHTRGEGHGACLEVFSPVTNNAVKLDQYLQDKEEMLDFNHLMIDGKTSTPRVITVGSHFKKGAMTATIDLKNDGLLNTDATEITEDGVKKTIQPIQMIQLVPATLENKWKGYDENCVIRDGNNYVVATTAGYTVYDAETLNEVETTRTTGRVKHLSLNNGKIASLTFDRQLTEEEDTTSAIPAHINIYPAGTTDFSVAPEHSFAVQPISPNNGKNTIQLVGDKVYACLGGAGLYCYDLEGNEKWHYQISSPINQKGQYRACANGCFVGGKYIYLAYGSAGLKVLDMDGKLIAERYHLIQKGNYSANYVTVYNGYIYVAHGKNRLQVYRLYNVDADTDVSYNE